MPKIEKNHTLKEYDNKYGDKELSVVSKKAADKDPSLLKGKKWWLIKDSYYQVKSRRRFLFIPLSLLAGGAITTAIAVPSVLNHDPVKFKVTFDADNGSAAIVQEVEKGKCATQPNNPEKADTAEKTYTFECWQEDSQSNSKFDFNTPVTRNINLKASYKFEIKKYFVTFDVQGHGDAPNSKELSYGDKITRQSINDPTANGYDFGGWYKEPSCQNEWKFDSDTIVGDTTLYAKWTRIEYEITYYLNDKATINPNPSKYTIEDDIPLSDPTPTASTDHFAGWYENSECTGDNIARIAKGTTGNKKLYANWTTDTYHKVTYVDDNDKLIDYVLVKEGEKAAKPADPKKEFTLENNYYFLNWKKADGTVFNFDTETISAEITLKAEFETKTWYLDNNYIKGLGSSDVGVERGVKVNNQLHTVRLIGINHDNDKNGNQLHTTWEFSNLISDSTGYSLGYQWNDTNDQATANNDYLNSSIRKVLCGNGNFSSTVYCSTKASTKVDTPTWDSTYTYTTSKNNTVLSMLPKELTDVLKTAKKTVRTGSDLSTTSTFNDKLFMLSATEMGSTSESKDEGNVYSYYNGATNDKRIKKQIKGAEGCLTNYKQIDYNAQNPTTKYTNYIWSWAGCNNSTKGHGGNYWLRSSYFESNGKQARDISVHGEIIQSNAFSFATAVAPAFCL